MNEIGHVVHHGRTSTQFLSQSCNTIKSDEMNRKNCPHLAKMRMIARKEERALATFDLAILQNDRFAHFYLSE